MTSARLGRALAVAGGALALVLAATGCTAAQNLGGQTVTPKVGECWQVSYADAAQSEDWEGTAPVACTTKHESYTYAVTKLTKTFTGSWLDSKGAVRADVDSAAFTACLSREKALLPGITPKEALFYPTYYVPSVAQWNGGARWVRCDMTEIKVGSEVAKPKLRDLPTRFSDVVAQLAANPKKFALCENDVFNNGPDGAQTSYADCTKPADWTFLLRLTLPDSDTAPYPGTAALKTLGAQKCAAAAQAEVGHDVVAKAPSSTDWVDNGVRTIDCWRNNN
jgi:Septum formation